MCQIARIAAILALTYGCGGDGLPTKPDEKRYRAADEWEKCRLTASRSILCTDEMIVEDVRALGIPDLPEAVAEDMARDNERPKLPSKDRRESIEVHKTQCKASRGTKFPDAVFDCWAEPDCKKFAACVSAKR